AEIEEKRQVEMDREVEQVVAPIQSRLAQLVNETDVLLNDPNAIPTNYGILGVKLAEENNKAKELLSSVAPTSNTQSLVDALRKTIEAANERVPLLETRGNDWNEFVATRERADALLDEVCQPLDTMVQGRKPSAEVNVELDKLREASSRLLELRNA